MPWQILALESEADTSKITTALKHALAECRVHQLRLSGSASSLGFLLFSVLHRLKHAETRAELAETRAQVAEAKADAAEARIEVAAKVLAPLISVVILVPSNTKRRSRLSAD